MAGENPTQTRAEEEGWFTIDVEQEKATDIYWG